MTIAIGTRLRATAAAQLVALDGKILVVTSVDDEYAHCTVMADGQIVDEGRPVCLLDIGAAYEVIDG